jgi:NPCBM-associated, NEW3 domain of alpha-galactosidase
MRKSLILFLFPLLLSQTLWLTSNTAAQNRWMDVEGGIEVKYEDSEDGAGRTVYYLNTGTERLGLSFKPGTSLPTGSRLRVYGRMRNGNLNVEQSEVVQAVETTSINHARGEQRQLVMLFNFQDQPNNKPWTASYVQDLLFTQVNTYWQSESYGATWITGDFTGWYTLPISSTDCQSNMRQLAEDGARALGYNPDSYSHKMYIYPSGGCHSNGGVTWTGTDSSGNFTSSVYLCGSVTFYSLGHEFGHTLDLSHSNSLNCSGVTFGTNCTRVEYGDHYDVMGYYNTGSANAYHRDLVGWLGARIQTVTGDGTYTITPLGMADTNLKALRIQQAYYPTTNSTTYYYVEYRQPVGYDSFLSSYPGVTSGVLLHLGTIGNDVNLLLRGSQLLDATPTVAGANEALGVGQSYYDPAIPVSVTVLSANSTGATVSVQFGAPTCAPASPTVAISPSSSSPAAPGTPVPYTVTVTNNDASSCSASSFNLQASVPSGWTASFTNPSPNINPGASASTTLTVRSASSASGGSHNIGVTATSSSSAYSGSASATYAVATSLAVAVSTNRSSYNRKQPVTMTSNVTANGSPVQGASVSFTMTKSNGATVTQSATTGSSGSASVRFQLKKPDPVGTYQGRGTASVNGVSGSAATTFTVQ